MKAGWDVRPLGQLVEIVSGGTPSKSREDFWQGDVPWVSPKDMKFSTIIDSEDHISDAAIASSATRLVKAGALLVVVRSGILARAIPVAIAGRDLTINQDIKAILPSHILTPRYLAYFFECRERELLDKVTRGATVHKLDTPAMKSLLVPIPPLEEQERLVAILDEAFEGLDRARANAEANLQSAWELFESYREDCLDPTRISNWSAWKLQDLVNIKHGFAFKSEFFVNRGEYVVLTPGNYYETGGFRDRGEKQRSYSGDFPSEFILRKGDLLMAMTEQAPGLLGSCILVPSDNRFLHNQRLGLITPKDGVVWNPEFFAHAFNLRAFRQALSDTCSGATVRHTSPGRILAQSIPYCNDPSTLADAASAMSEREQDCRNLQRLYKRKLKNIAELRQSLLQKAFAGELT